MAYWCSRCSRDMESHNHVCANLPPEAYNKTCSPQEIAEIRHAARIEGARWALERGQTLAGLGLELARMEATRIVTERERAEGKEKGNG